jgi:hypothetical protein
MSGEPHRGARQWYVSLTFFECPEDNRDGEGPRGVAITTTPFNHSTIINLTRPPVIYILSNGR